LTPVLGLSVSVVLHIITRTEDVFAQDIIARQRLRPECSVQVVDLSQGEPDYDQLLDAIFAADSIQVW
jgi:hypothetical protein